MLKLHNGIVIYLQRNDQPAFTLTIDGYGGSIKDCALKTPGLCHLFEHLAFKEYQSNLYINGFTNATNLSFIFSPLYTNLKKKELNNSINYISNFFFQNDDFSKIELLPPETDTRILASKIEELTNEYIYRKSSMGASSIPVFLNSNAMTFDFCGNQDTFTDINLLKQNIKKINTIPTNMVTIFLNKNIYSPKEIEILVNLFSQVKPNISNKLLSFNGFPHMGQTVCFNTEVFTLCFKLNISLENALIFFKSISFSIITASKMMDGVMIQFVFVSNRHLSDFLFLLATKDYREIINAANHCSYNILFDDVFYLFEREELLKQDVPFLQQNYHNVLYDIFGQLNSELINKNFVIFQPKEFNYFTEKTIFSEEYIVANYDLCPNYIYMKTLPMELQALYQTHNLKNDRFVCNNKSIHELTLENSVGEFFNRYSDSSFYQSLFLFYFTTPNITNTLSFDRTNIPVFIKGVLDNLENGDEEVDIVFKNQSYNITSNYNFFNMILKIKNDLVEEFNNRIPFVIENSKHKGLLYYLAIQKQTNRTFSYISLYSIINNFDTIKTIIINLNNELSDLIEDKIVIISKKGSKFELPPIIKNVSLKF